mmetsp:Transcript_110850/g.253995  ORF Transcript_110850/g.253995 Transcript_110850/m.253995 type:complete len:387 (-) Transcript_110850:146-1306(-)
MALREGISGGQIVLKHGFIEERKEDAPGAMRKAATDYQKQPAEVSLDSPGLGPGSPFDGPLPFGFAPAMDAQHSPSTEPSGCDLEATKDVSATDRDRPKEEDAGTSDCQIVLKNGFLEERKEDAPGAMRKAATDYPKPFAEFTPFSSDPLPGTLSPGLRPVAPDMAVKSEYPDQSPWPPAGAYYSSFSPGLDQCEQPCPPGLDPASPLRAPVNACEAFFPMPQFMPMGYPMFNCEIQGFDPRVQKLLYRQPAGATTIIVQIIPNKMTQRMLLNVWKDLGFGGCIDLFYLPMDFRKKRNIGYGYVNFTTESEAMLFERKVDGMQVPNVNSPKRLTAAKAKEQGFFANFWKIWEAAKKRGRCPPEARPLILDPDTKEEIEFPVPLGLQ